MDSNPVIFDISSDEEPAFDDLKVSDDEHEWLTELLETVDREKADSDDVVVVGEYVPPKPKSKSKSSKIVKNIDDDDDDDDCIVLDGDPDKPVDVDDGQADDGDDVLVVGQKGQIACRDYPHPRHLCAKFPFGSTPHEKHCDLCHCYVCDSFAPCGHWGSGFSTIDHCHATDKLEIWKNQRQERFWLKKNASLPVPKISEVHFPLPAPQLNQVDIPLPLMYQEMQNPVYRPTTIRACSSTRLNTPNIMSQNKYRRPVCVQSRNGYMPRSVPQQAVSVRSNAVLRNSGQQFVSCNAMFKRSGIHQGASMNQSVYVSPNLNRPPASHHARNPVSAVTANTRNSAGWQDVLPSMIPDSDTYVSPSQPNTGCFNVKTVATQAEVYGQALTWSNDDQNNLQYGNQSQNVLDSCLPDFDLSWIDNFGQSNQHTSMENNLQATVPNNVVETENQSASELGASSKLPSKDNGFESWLLGQSNGVSPEGCGCGPADLNIFSPEPAYVAGMLCFDFDTTWNGLAQV